MQQTKPRESRQRQLALYVIVLNLLFSFQCSTFRSILFRPYRNIDRNKRDTIARGTIANILSHLPTLVHKAYVLVKQMYSPVFFLILFPVLAILYHCKKTVKSEVLKTNE